MINNETTKKIITPTKPLDILLSGWDKAYRPLGRKTNLYKFRQTSGSTTITKFGEVENNVDLEKNIQQNLKIYTGKEPITIYWENSTKLEAQNDNTIKQTFQIGNYHTIYQKDITSINSSNDNKKIFNVDYTTEQIKYSLSFESVDWIPNENDIQDYFYLMLDKKANCNKWLQITSVTPYYNEVNNTIQYVEITFESINDKFSETGRTILDFIQNGAIGDGFAFPKEKWENGKINVELDDQYLPENRNGVNSIQYDFMSGAANLSFFHIGRRKSIKNSDNTYTIETPKLLFLYDVLQPNKSNLFYNQPNLNSYISMNAQPTIEGIWNSYKQAFQGNNLLGSYNVLNQKKVLGGLKTNDNEVRKTNPDLNSWANYDKNIKVECDFKDQFSFDTSPYHQATPYLKRNLSYSDFFNINAFATFGMDVFNYEYKETKKWKLTETLGVLGSVVNFIIGGIDIGWTTAKKFNEVFGKINCTIPCVSFESGKIAVDNNSPLSFDVFNDNQEQHILPLPINVMTSWRFRFTDKFIDSSQIKHDQPIGRGGNGIWDTKYLGQTKYEDGTWINENHTPFKLNLQTFEVYRENEDIEWVLDFTDFKTIGICDYRISAYDKANQIIYSSINKTNAKVRNDIRIIANQIKFNFWDKYNTSGEVSYPEKVENLPPNYSLIGEEQKVDIPLNKNLFNNEYKTNSNFNEGAFNIIKYKDREIMNMKSYLEQHSSGFEIHQKTNFNFTNLYNGMVLDQNVVDYDTHQVSFENINLSNAKKIFLDTTFGEIELNQNNNFTYDLVIPNYQTYRAPLYCSQCWTVQEYIMGIQGAKWAQVIYGANNTNGNYLSYNFSFENIKVNIKAEFDFLNKKVIFKIKRTIGIIRVNSLTFNQSQVEEFVNNYIKPFWNSKGSIEQKATYHNTPFTYKNAADASGVFQYRTYSVSMFSIWETLLNNDKINRVFIV